MYGIGTKVALTPKGYKKIVALDNVVVTENNLIGIIVATINEDKSYVVRFNPISPVELEIGLLEEDILPLPEEALTLDELPTYTEITKGPIKSTGGSSTYYDIGVPPWLLELLNERAKTGKCFLKTEELIEILKMDFDEGNIQKCLIRIISLKRGCGKEGNSVEYDSNKIRYSANRLIEREHRGK